MLNRYICPACYSQWENDIGKCPCRGNTFVTKLARFLASTDLERLHDPRLTGLKEVKKQWRRYLMAKYPS